MLTRRRHPPNAPLASDAATPAPRRRPPLVLIAGAALALVLALAWLVLRHPSGQAAQPGGAEQSLVVQPRPFAATIGVTGTIAPGEDIDVTAPFDGVVRRVNFEDGGQVAEGQVLVELDTSEVRQRRNEAEAAFLKASQAADEMATWTTGPDVSRARRAETEAAYNLKDTQRKIAETKALLDHGLVARSEYDALIQQQRSQQMSQEAAEQDLAAALRRGQGPNRQVTTLELENARAHLAELDAQLASAVVRAPAAGVIMRPPGDKSEGGGAIHAGQSLTKGRLIGSIARTSGLGVAFRLGEADANRVRPGQAVIVTGPGFGGYALNGHIASVGGEALPPTATSGPMTSFAATAKLDPLTPAQAAAVRIGMTANVAIEVYRAPAALAVPPAAVQGAAPAATVTVKDPATGHARLVAVRLGQVAPDGVEVLSGLKPGDVVVWTPTTTPDGQAPGG
jgi:HlyD family secretion protein